MKQSNRFAAGLHYFRKVGSRQAQAIAKVSLAAWVRVHDGRIQDLRIALGSVAPKPLRALGAEAALRGATLAAPPLEAALKALQADIAPSTTSAPPRATAVAWRETS